MEATLTRLLDRHPAVRTFLIWALAWLIGPHAPRVHVVTFHIKTPAVH